MRMILHEIRKLLLDKAFVFIAVLLFLFCCLYAAFSPIENDYTSQRHYDKLKADISGRSQEEIGDILEEGLFAYQIYDSLMWGGGHEEAFGDSRAAAYVTQYETINENSISIYGQLLLYQKEYDNWNNIQHYGQHISDIINEANSMSTFSLFRDESSFSYKNTIATANAFVKMAAAQPEYAISEGVRRVISNIAVDISLLLILCLAAFKLFSEEKSSGKTVLTLSMPNGSGKFALAKLLALILIALAFGLIWTALSMGVNEIRFGLGNLTRAIQSVEGYYNSPLRLNVWQSLLLVTVTKSVAAICFAFAAAFFSMIARELQGAFLLTLIWVCTGIGMYSPIDNASILAPIKYASVFSLLNCDVIYGAYLNLDINSQPVNTVLLSWFFCVFFILVLAAAVVLLYRKTSMQPSRRKALFTSKNASVGIIANELNRMLIARKGLAVLLLVGLGYACYIGSFNRLLDLDDMMYADYIRAAGGEITERTYDYIEGEQERFHEVNQELAKLSQMFANGDLSANNYNTEYAFVSQKLMGERSFIRMVAQLETVSVNEKAALIYDTGYAKLTAAGGTRNDVIPALFVLFLLILCVSPMYSSDSESGVSALIRSTQYGGKRLLKRRIAIAAAMSGLLCVAAYGAQFWRIISLYGAQNLASPVQSLTNLVDFPLEVSIGGYLLLINVARMLLFAFSSMVILAVSSYCKKSAASFILSAALLGIPLLLLSRF